MQSKIITITSPTSTGNVSYTGVGFQPKLVLAMGAKTATGSTANAVLLLGAATDSTHRVSGNGTSSDNVATSAVGNARSTTVLIQYRTAGGTNQVQADLVSMDADGFTLNWTPVNATTRTFTILCIAGSDVSAAVGQSAAPATNTTQSVTGLSFQPNLVLFFDSRLGSTATGSGSFWRPMFGAMDAAGNQCSWAGDSYDAVATKDTHYIQTTSGCIIGTGSTSGGIDRKAAFSSMNSDGFTLTWSGLDATVGVNSQYFYVALSVPNALVGNLVQPTATGTQDVATTGFTPSVMIIGGTNQTATNGGGQQHRFSIGFATTAAEQGVSSHADADNVGTSSTSNYHNSGSVLRTLTAGGASPTTLTAADVSAVAASKFTLNFSTVDATSSLVFYIAMGDTNPSGRVPRRGYVFVGRFGVC